MNNNPISPDDPRLTSYALNEMAPDERVAFERELAQDAPAQLAVEQIRRTSDQLTAALQHEVASSEDMTLPATATQAPPARIIRFPYWMGSSLAAACFAVAFIYWQREQWPQAVVDSSTAPIVAEVAPKDEAKSIAADGKATVASSNMMMVAGAAPSVARAPQSAAVEPAAQSAEQDQTGMNRLRAEELRVTGQTAKADDGAREKQQVAQVQAALAKKSPSANQPLADAGQLGNEADPSQRDQGFLHFGTERLDSPASVIIKKAMEDFQAVLSGKSPANSRIDSKEPLPADGGTAFYVAEGYSITVVKSRVRLAGVDGYIYGASIRFDGTMIVGNRDAITQVRFYSREELRKLLDQE